MYDGSVRAVEDIEPGEMLMGDDSRPRRVIRTLTGRERMFCVRPAAAEPFICNESHILTLIRDTNLIIDISIRDYLDNLAHDTHSDLVNYRLFKVAVDFPAKTVITDPYIIGATINGRANGKIPAAYLTNTREIRMQILAGIIDAHGVRINDTYAINMAGMYYVTQEHIRFLCESLGFILGHDNHLRSTPAADVCEIPVRITERITGTPQVAGRVSRMMPFVCEELPSDQYYGFELDGNNRYLLASFIVTHNTGKTWAALSIAQEFINIYRKNYASAAAKISGRRSFIELDNNSPSVFVLGFGGTKTAFIRDALKSPSFGFITPAEREELTKRQHIAAGGLPDDVQYLKEYYSMLKKRLTNKSKGGFYRFLGYDELVNRLFTSDTVKLIDLENITARRIKAGETITLEDVFREHIVAGTIQVNTRLLDSMKNSLIIADEVHNTYNMNMKNNRGVALQYILDIVESVWLLTMSATASNNSPTEAVELVGYMLPAGQKITKKQFFSSPSTLRPGKLEELGALTRGKISFLQDTNIKFYPRRVFAGKDYVLPGPSGAWSAGQTLPYLKFIECPMSEMHQYTYFLRNHAIEEDVDDDLEKLGQDDKHAVSASSYTLYDMVFPNPDSTMEGLYRSSDIRAKIAAAPQAWRDANMIGVRKFSANNHVIVGDYLRRENIGRYSSKSAQLLDELKDIMSLSQGDPGKVRKTMIYHERVATSGVLFTQELLRANGYLDEYSEPIESTICCVCGKILTGHSKGHDFHPARFVMAHSDMDKLVMNDSMSKFNTPDNCHGLNYFILVGSKIIKESYDFKDCQELIIESLPTNIPTALQVFGRCVRKHSHINLPPEQRQVTIRILVSTVNTAYPSTDLVSAEMHRYASKLTDYMVIQEIEREFNRNAIDADINRDINMSPDRLAEYFPAGSQDAVPQLGNLYFEPFIKLPNYKLSDLNLSTFTANKYYEEEVKNIMYIIKRLFLSEPVWTYDHLWETVRAPPFGIEVNPAFFAEDNFIIALSALVDKSTRVISATNVTQELLTDRLFDSSVRVIHKQGIPHKIEAVGTYYILFPIMDIPANPVRSKPGHVDKIIPKGSETDSRVMIDVETYLRPIYVNQGVRINVQEFVKNTRQGANYLAKRAQFVASSADFLTMSMDFQIAFVEEAIIAMITGADDAKHREVVQLLDDFGVIIKEKEVKKYKAVASHYKDGIPAGKLSDCTPFGYMVSKSIRLYDPASQQWIELNKMALNRHMAWKENDTIIGYFEPIGDIMKFKLRKPEQHLTDNIGKITSKASKSEMAGHTVRAAVHDTRLIERGVVCGTKNKYDLLKILASLGVSVSSLERNQVRIHRLCNIIKARIIELEIKERNKDSQYKYLYSWWNELPQLKN